MSDLCEIVAGWLEANGYDGLCYSDFDCGCGLGVSFMPCGEPSPRCEPAFRRECNDCPELESEDRYCDGEPGEHCWHSEKLEVTQ